MVLKNSKWDKQAKLRFLKKHGLVKKRVNEGPSPKWSSKRGRDERSINSIGEWSQDDEEVLNQMFPELGTPELTAEQREKVKSQILAGLLEEQSRDKESRDKDGIYLGTNETEEQEEAAPLTLEEFVSKDIGAMKKYNRQLPSKNADQSNVLEEYGIESLNDTIKNHEQTDYNDIYRNKQKHRPIFKISSEELDGFQVGVDTLGMNEKKSENTNSVEILSEQDKIEHAKRQEKARQAKFYDSVKSKFDPERTKKTSKVLEVHNLNVNDKKSVDWLERKIQASDKKGYNSDDDDELLGQILGGMSFKDEIQPSESQPLDSFLSDLNSMPVEEPKSSTSAIHAKETIAKPAPANDFLDSILG